MKPSQIAATALVLSIGAGAYTAGYELANHPDSASGVPTVATVPVPTTRVTIPVLVPPPAASTTTTVPVIQPHNVDGPRRTPNPPPRPTPPPTTVVTHGRCGTGTATATASVEIAPAEKTADTDYVESGNVHLVSGMDKPITVDQLVVHLDYGDGTFETVTPAGADGIGLAPGESKDLGFSRTTARPVQDVSIAGFGYHTTGQPQCVATPA